jgi:hypothetical protein
MLCANCIIERVGLSLVKGLPRKTSVHSIAELVQQRIIGLYTTETIKKPTAEQLLAELDKQLQAIKKTQQ